MRKIRIGKDIKVVWKVTTDGKDSSLVGRDLTLELSNITFGRVPIDFSIKGNSISFAFRGVDHRDCLGVYSLTLWENKGQMEQNVLDYDEAFRLVSNTALEGKEESSDNIEIETVNLGTSDFSFAGGSSVPGRNGATFIPFVDSQGNISWTNDGNLPNPRTVNIKGPRGVQGRDGRNGNNGADGARGPQGPRGPQGSVGLPGLQGPKGEPGQNGKTPYIGDNGNWWIGGRDTNKPSRGPQGEPGEGGGASSPGRDGTTFIPSVDAEGNLSWTNADGKPNPETVNVKGQDGADGVSLGEKPLVHEFSETEGDKQKVASAYGIARALTTRDDTLKCYGVADDSCVIIKEGQFPSVFIRNLGMYLGDKVLVISTSDNEDVSLGALRLPMNIPADKLQDPSHLDVNNFLDAKILLAEKGKTLFCSLKNSSSEQKVISGINFNSFSDLAQMSPRILSGCIQIINSNRPDFTVNVVADTTVLYCSKTFVIKKGAYHAQSKSQDNFRPQVYLYLDTSIEQDSYAIKFKYFRNKDVYSSNIFRLSDVPVLHLFSAGFDSYVLGETSRINKRFVFFSEGGIFNKPGVSDNVNILDLGAVADANYHVFDYESEDSRSPKFGKAVGWYVDEACTIPATDNSFIFKYNGINSIYVPRGNFYIDTSNNFVSKITRITGCGCNSCFCSTKPNWQPSTTEDFFTCRDIKLINLGNSLSCSNKIDYWRCDFDFNFKSSGSIYCFMNSGINIIRNCVFKSLNHNFCVLFLDDSHDSLVEECSVFTPNSGRAISLTGNVQNFTVRRNRVYNPAGITGIFSGSSRVAASKNIVIEDNDVFGCTEESITFDGFGNNKSLMPAIAHTTIVGTVYLPSVKDSTGETFKRVGLKLSTLQKWGKVGEGQFDFGYVDMTPEDIQKINFEKYIWFVSSSSIKGLSGEIVKFNTETNILETNICDANNSIPTDGSAQIEIMAGGFNVTVRNNYVRGNYGNGTDLTWDSGTGVCLFMGVINADVYGNRIEGLPKGIWSANLAGEDGIPVYNENIRIHDNLVVGSRMSGLFVQSSEESNMYSVNNAVYNNTLIDCRGLHLNGQWRIQYLNNSLVETPLYVKGSGKKEYLPQPTKNLLGQTYTIFKYPSVVTDGYADDVDTVVCKKSLEGTYVWKELWRS